MPDGSMAIQDPAVAGANLAANVIDIRRFSTHDGHGIRTTIFLKGCSLECAWCQNPESIEPRLGPVFFRNRCIDCLRCVEIATDGEATVDDEGKVHVDVTVQTADWMRLVDACPTGAIAFNATRYTVAQLVDIAQRDRVFFGDTGGVTLSGGEPLFMPHFAQALLAALQAEGIHTAVETALNVREKFIRETLKHADQILADLKLIDPDEHLKYTGSSNAQILHNVEVLLTSHRRDDVTIRTPMIPGVTTTEANLTGIAEFITALYPDVKYELLNYNPLAAAKYDLLPGKKYLFDKETQPQMYSAAEMDEFADLVRSAGVRNLVLG